MLEVVQRTVKLLHQNVLDNYDLLLENLKMLRNACANNPPIQEDIACNPFFPAAIMKVLYPPLTSNDETSKKYQQLQITAWQLLANTIVQNERAKEIVWARFGRSILTKCSQPPINKITDIQLMIIYNIAKEGDSANNAIKAVCDVWQTIIEQKCDVELSFLDLIFENFLVKDGFTTVTWYRDLEISTRIALLDYIAHYIRQNNPNGLIDTVLLEYISKDFKLKSDCVLRQKIDENVPREAYALLRVIASATGSDDYAHIYKEDQSLFLNVSSLLRYVVAAGKKPEANVFTPMNKLEEVATASNIAHDFEAEISYELKTLLVRCIANLLYQNKKNQIYAAETELMPALLECTNMDARNPLIKEWSILAIRNACFQCQENQNVIAGLTERGVAQNDIMTELNLEMGSMRIQPSK